MDQFNLRLLSEKLKIAPLNIVRENIEIEILNFLAKSDTAKKVIFYGGSALRLAYGSPRFSVDLDFLMIEKVKDSELKNILMALIKEHNEIITQIDYKITLKDFKDKRNTLFALINIEHPSLKHHLNLKIEVSKRKNNVRYEFIPLSSPCSHLTPIIPTCTIESLKELKEEALKRRKEPRDWFDLWYVSKYLKEPFYPPRKFLFEKKEFKRELKRFLPQNSWILIDQMLKT